MDRRCAAERYEVVGLRRSVGPIPAAVEGLRRGFQSNAPNDNVEECTRVVLLGGDRHTFQVIHKAVPPLRLLAGQVGPRGRHSVQIKDSSPPQKIDGESVESA